MKIPGPTPIHLTYCLNVHPGEGLDDQRAAIDSVTRPLRDRLCPDAPFGLGLRLGAEAARDLSAPDALRSFRGELEDRGMYAFTINGFPYGRFHDGPVKEAVYQPDWTTEERRLYTIRLIDILATLLPDEEEGSISTVPLAFHTGLADAETRQAACANLAATALYARRALDERGACIHIGLEPEPSCRLETIPEFIDFYESELLPSGIEAIRAQTGESPERAEACLRRHIGICLDTCHQAIAFEDLAGDLRALEAAGIRLSKIQLSAALEAVPDQEARAALAAFDEPVYLHQARLRRPDGCILGTDDLPAIRLREGIWTGEGLLRVHFHVPLFWAGSPPLQSTRACLDTPFWDVMKNGACPHLEIETYTFHVLPDDMRPDSIMESIAAEYDWVLDKLSPRPAD